MLVIDNENIDPFDIDGTLIIHQRLYEIPMCDRIEIYDPITESMITVRINRPMVRLLKESRARGFYVLVWSRGGKEWAKNVIEALNLNEYVHQIMSKPRAYFDDTPVQEWLTDRIFIGPDIVYKK